MRVAIRVRSTCILIIDAVVLLSSLWKLNKFKFTWLVFCFYFYLDKRFLFLVGIPSCRVDREAPSQFAYLVRSWCDGSSDRSFMVYPLSYFLFQPVLHDWCTKGRGMCYPVCGMGAYKRTLAANRKRVAHVTAAGFVSRYHGHLPYV